MNIEITWADDCQGKKDYDADLVQLSSRYWPRGGGFTAIVDGAFQANLDRQEIKPSAASRILLGGETLVRAEFDGETEDEVKAKVEAWAAEQIARVEYAIRSAFTT